MTASTTTAVPHASWCNDHEECEDPFRPDAWEPGYCSHYVDDVGEISGQGPGEPLRIGLSIGLVDAATTPEQVRAVALRLIELADLAEPIQSAGRG